MNNGESGSIRKIMECVSELENKYPVKDYIFEGIEIWPLVRYILLKEFKDDYANKARSKSRPIELNKKVHGNPGVQLIRFFKSCIAYTIDLLKFKTKVAGTEILLYSRYVENSDIVSGDRFDRVIDPLLEKLLAKDIKACKVSLDSPSLPDQAHPSINFPVFKYYPGGQILNFKRRLGSVVPGDESLNELRLCTGYVVSNDEIKKLVGNSLMFKRIFLRMLRHVKPRLVIIRAYYAPDSFGLIMACKKLQIPTVDVQHGKQGRFHPMYSHWMKIPENGYSLLPDFFWTWGDASRNNIARWMPPDSPHHVVAGGNLWLARWKRSGISNDPDAEKLLKRIKPYRKVILYSLQPIGENNFPEFVRKILQNPDPACCWLIRLHPFMKHTDVPILKELLSRNPHIEFELSTKLPLYWLLQMVHLHLTPWSSVAFEAEAFGVPSVIIHENGRKLYEEEIRSGQFREAWDEESLKQELSKTLEIIKGSDYISIDPAKAEAALEIILAKAGITRKAPSPAS